MSEPSYMINFQCTSRGKLGKTENMTKLDREEIHVMFMVLKWTLIIIQLLVSLYNTYFLVHV